MGRGPWTLTSVPLPKGPPVHLEQHIQAPTERVCPSNRQEDGSLAAALLPTYEERGEG